MERALNHVYVCIQPLAFVTIWRKAPTLNGWSPSAWKSSRIFERIDGSQLWILRFAKMLFRFFTFFPFFVENVRFVVHKWFTLIRNLWNDEHRIFHHRVFDAREMGFHYNFRCVHRRTVVVWARNMHIEKICADKNFKNSTKLTFATSHSVDGVDTPRWMCVRLFCSFFFFTFSFSVFSFVFLWWCATSQQPTPS